MADWEQLHSRARELCNEYNHFFVGTEHLFMAALDLEPWLRKILEQADADIAKVTARIMKIAEKGEGPPLWSGYPVTPRVKRVLKIAEREARDENAGRVLAGHVIAAVLKEGRGIPARVLSEFDVHLEAVRQGILRETRRAPKSRQDLPEAAGARRMEGMEGMMGIADVINSPDARSGQGVEVNQGRSERSGSGGSSGASGRSGEEKGASSGAGQGGKKTILDDYGRDLVALAREGRMDPVIGRQDEIRRCIQILTRKGKNNPVLIGEAGVGKSSVAYGLAQRIASGRVPEVIQDHEVWELSMNRIVAGAAYRGEFQDRLQKIMDEVAQRPNIILFIDELHMLMGAGDHKGGMDAGNILKPALARGEFPVIGATTTDEFRKTIESDPALERRFQPVLVAEPSEAECLQILEGLRHNYERHHEVEITDGALRAAIKLSTRYLPDRNLPDKAIDLIDEAAAYVKIPQLSMSISPDASPERLRVREEDVAEVVSKWSGVPVTRLTQEESERLLHIDEHLRGRVVGQDEAVRVVAQTIRVMRMGFGNPSRPGGVFMFLGPTGVGKTELAKALAEFLFDSEKELVRIDMSEYMEKHAISRLIGSPPGYVGHEEEGQLTKAVRTKPYSVVLLDEIEKAHPDVFDLFLQVFDDGRLTDSKGRTVNFTNTVIILTSNVGARSDDPNFAIEPDNPDYVESVLDALRKKFKPEFLNRIDETVMFRPLGRQALEQIVDLQLTDVTRRVRESRGVMLAVEPDARELLLVKGYSPAYGARPLKRAVQTLLVKPLAEEVLRSGFRTGDLVNVKARDGRLVFSKASLSLDGDEDADEAPPPPSPRRGGDGPRQGGDGPRRDGSPPRDEPPARPHRTLPDAPDDRPAPPRRNHPGAPDDRPSPPRRNHPDAPDDRPAAPRRPGREDVGRPAGGGNATDGLRRILDVPARRPPTDEDGQDSHGGTLDDEAPTTSRRRPDRLDLPRRTPRSDESPSREVGLSSWDDVPEDFFDDHDTGEHDDLDSSRDRRRRPR